MRLHPTDAHKHACDSQKKSRNGIRHKRYIDTHWYWSEYGYGTLFGKRSGYRGVWGGGSAPHGGGLMVNPVISLGYPITSDFVISLEGGYIHFMNGDISSPTIGFSGTLNFWNLYAE